MNFATAGPSSTQQDAKTPLSEPQNVEQMSNDDSPPVRAAKTAKVKVLELMNRYWHIGLSCHFIFITFNGAIVLGLVVTLSPSTSNSLSALLFTAIGSGLTILIYLYGGYLTFSQQ